MKKRAQFYLVAVIIILAIVASIAAVYNKVITKPEDKFVYDLSKEIEFEVSKILDNGVFLGSSETQLKREIKNITDYYADKNPLQDMIVVFGINDNVTIFYYNKTQSGSVSFTTGGSQLTLQIQNSEFQEQTFGRTSSTITINITNEVSYTYELRKGQFVFVILKKEKDGEVYISTPK